MNRCWLSNASYQPLLVESVPNHEDLPPPYKKTKENKKQRENEGKKSSPKPPPKPKTNWFDDCGLAPQEAYRLDPISDRANLQYSALYSGDIANYRRRFGGQCVGLGPHQTIEWTDNRGKKYIKTKSKEKVTRYFISSLPENDACFYLAASRDRADTKITSRQSHAPFFMALESSASAGEIEDVKERVEGISCELASEVFVSQQTATYNRALQDDPHNVDLWLEFLEFQPSLQMRVGGEGGLGRTTKAMRAVNERKRAIFERALKHNPTSMDLLVGHLELLCDVGREPETVLKKWRDLVFRMPNKSLLWLKYSEFCRMQFSTFSSSSLCSLYQKSFKTLTSILEGVMQSHTPEPNTTEHLLALFTQFCHFLAAAGQNERAVACYQALVEYNLCCPPHLSSTVSSQKIAFFEPFWDSGAPRLGEDGAVGWNQWLLASESQQVVKPLGMIDAHFLAPSEDSSGNETEQGDPELSLIAGHTLAGAWVLLENYRQQMDALPFRGSDDDLTDPERAVLFEDISRCLFTVDNEHLLLKLVLQYLRFLGAVSTCGAPCLDTLPQFLSPHLHCPLDALYTSTSPAVVPTASHTSLRDDYSIRYPHNFCGVSSGYSSLFTAHLLQPVEHPRPPLPTCQFISNTFNQLLSLLPHPEMQTTVALDWIRFELSLLIPSLRDTAQVKSRETRHRVKAVQKLVKSLLKQESHRNDLCLWDCCAQLEYLLGGFQEAQTLYETVLSQYPVITQPLLPLYLHYCEVLLGLTAHFSTPTSAPFDTSHALQLTVCVAEGKYVKPSEDTISPSSILRARHLYEQKAIPDKPCYLVVCHAYFEYISKGIESANKIFDECTSAQLSQLSNHSHDERSLQIDLHFVVSHQVSLLVHHAHSKPMPTSLIVNTLERVLSTFPNDPHFLSVYTDAQQPLYLMGKLRKYFDTHAPKAQTALPWVHAIRAEVARYKRVQEGEMEGTTDVPAGLVNRIRALLGRAIQSDNGRSCPLLWRLAICFEVLPCTYNICPYVYSHTCMTCACRWSNTDCLKQRLYSTKPSSTAQGQR